MPPRRHPRQGRRPVRRALSRKADLRHSGDSLHHRRRPLPCADGADQTVRGDLPLALTLNLAPLASHLTLLHRRQEFRAAPDSVNKMMALAGEGKIDLVLGQVTALEGKDGQVEKAIVKRTDGSNFEIACDAILPFFGLTMKLGPVVNWGIKF